jgi:hypothetical protein
MKKIYLITVCSLILFVLSACNSQSTQTNVSLTFNRSDFSFMNWQVDGSHTAHVTGKIIADQQPIVGVKLQINGRIVTTDNQGEFYFTVNRNILGSMSIHTINSDQAKINGKNVEQNTKKALLALKKDISVEYPIKIEKVKTNATDKNLVDVYAHAQIKKGEKYPNFTPDKYKVGGTVKDADGHPVQGAVVNLRRDGVEGFSMSTPSDQNGNYTLYYLPDADTDHYFYVHYDGKNYTLPEYKVYNFPDRVSVNIDVTLPRDGTIITDKPPTLVTTTAPGALYKGTLIGVNVSKNESYTISIPKPDGSFVLTLPKAAWDQHPTFFEVSYSKFLEEGKKSGDIVDSSFIPQPKNTDPAHIQAIGSNSSN